MCLLQAVATTNTLFCYYEPSDRSCAVIRAMAVVSHDLEWILAAVHVFEPLQHKDLSDKVD